MGYTNSLTNLLMGSSKPPTPVVGMGATLLYYTDRHAATVVAVSANGKTIEVKQDNAKRTDNNGMSESQEYEYTPNPEGRAMVFTLRKNGRWVAQGEPLKNGLRLGLGYREEYHDFSF